MKKLLYLFVYVLLILNVKSQVYLNPSTNILNSPNLMTKLTEDQDTIDIPTTNIIYFSNAVRKISAADDITNNKYIIYDTNYIRTDYTNVETPLLKWEQDYSGNITNIIIENYTNTIEINGEIFSQQEILTLKSNDNVRDNEDIFQACCLENKLF